MLSTLRRPLVAQAGLRAVRPLPVHAPVIHARGLASKPPQGVVSYAVKLMSDPLIETIALASRIARILVGSVLVVGSVTFVVWEGAHQYVERVAMPSKGEVEEVTANDAYGWEMDDVLHHLGITSSTDPRLGMFGRHIVRSAWMAENWGGGIAPQAIFGLAPRGLPVNNIPDVETQQGLRLAERFLSTSLHIADARNIRVQEFELTDKPLDTTAVALEAWLANVRTKLGTPNALAQAGLAYEKLYDAFAVQPNAGAFCALLATRLGMLQGQIGHAQQSLEWFDRALRTSTEKLVHEALSGREMLRTPLDARAAVRVLQALSRVYVHASTTSSTPRDGLYAALRTQLAVLRLTQAEQARSGVGADAELQQAWAKDVQGQTAVQVAETLFALQRHPQSRSWLSWFKRDALLDSRPEEFGAHAKASPGAYEVSRAWLLFATECATSVQAQLLAEGPTPSFAALSRKHASERIRLSAHQVETEAQLLLRVLEKRETA